MNARSEAQCEELRANLIALTSNCPVDHCNPADCPLFELRRMGLQERVKWFNALGEDDLMYLATYHHVCLHLKFNLEQVEIGGSI